MRKLNEIGWDHSQTVEFCINEPHASNVRRLLIITAVFRIKLVKLPYPEMFCKKITVF